MNKTCSDCSGVVSIPMNKGVIVPTDASVIDKRTDFCPNGHKQQVGILKMPPGNVGNIEVWEYEGTEECLSCSRTAQIGARAVGRPTKYVCPRCIPGPLMRAFEAIYEDI